jgi:hypothetical protein
MGNSLGWAVTHSMAVQMQEGVDRWYNTCLLQGGHYKPLNLHKECDREGVERDLYPPAQGLCMELHRKKS